MSIARGSIELMKSYPCWVCEHNPSMAFVARASLNHASAMVHLCDEHEVELAAVLLRWKDR